MQYMGSKRRIAKEILSIILKDRKENQLYVEPFAGGMNIVENVTNPRIASDTNYYLISLYRSMQEGYLPPAEISREDYYYVKSHIETTDPALVGFVAFGCSFGGKWFNGYAFNNKGDNYALRSRNVLVKQTEKLRGTQFFCLSYDKLSIPEGSIVYCDPPYQSTTAYKDGLNYDHFWNWVREISRSNTVFVSEYSAPDDFKCIWEKEIKTTLDKNSQYTRKERLFTIG